MISGYEEDQNRIQLWPVLVTRYGSSVSKTTRNFFIIWTNVHFLKKSLCCSIDCFWNSKYIIRNTAVSTMQVPFTLKYCELHNNVPRRVNFTKLSLRLLRYSICNRAVTELEKENSKFNGLFPYCV